MKRLLVALCACVAAMMVWTGNAAASGELPVGYPDQSFENGGGTPVNVGANNNQVLVGAGNEANGNTNTSGDQTAFNGNNEQQSNTAVQNQQQSADGGTDGHPPAAASYDGGSPDSTCCPSQSQEQGSGQHNSASGGSGDGGQEFQNSGGTPINIGANNNQVLIGADNQANNNTNTSGDQTAFNGNNEQQTNRSVQNQRQSSEGTSEEPTRENGPIWDKHGEKDGKPKHEECCPTQSQSQHTHQSNSSEDNSRPKHKCGCENGNGGGQEFENGGGTPINAGLNNNQVLVGGGHDDKNPGNANLVPIDGGNNQANGNTNTSGDQTAFNGNNQQQTNSSVQNQRQRSGGAEPVNSTPRYEKESCKQPKYCEQPKGDECCASQSQRQGAWQSNRSSGSGGPQDFKNGGGTPINIGANNNQLLIGAGNQANGNTNTSGDQTAFNGNNQQQTNRSVQNQRQRSSGSCCDGNEYPKKGGYSKPKDECCPSQSQSQGAWQSNSSGGSGCHPRCGPPKSYGCDWKCEPPKEPPKHCGCDKPNGEVSEQRGSSSNGKWKYEQPKNHCGCERPKNGKSSYGKSSYGKSKNGKSKYGKSKYEQPKKHCGCEQPKYDKPKNECGCEGQHQKQYAHQSNRSHGSGGPQSFENGGGTPINAGLNNNQVLLGENPLSRTFTNGGGGSNEANNNTNTSGDQTAFNGNNKQQKNSAVQNQRQRSGGDRPDYMKEVPTV